jgi:DNA topoisomerase-1
MENQGLGTKATRSQILQILYNRGYLIGRSIEVTELGLQLSDILEKNVPDVISEKLTRHFEEECDLVESGKIKKEAVLEEAKNKLIKICDGFRKKEEKIGKELTEAVIATQDKQNILGTCPKCSGTLKVFKMWRTGKRFVGCTGYKKGCRFGMPLPREGIIMSTEKVCEECKTPIIQVYRQGARPFRMCIDIKCPTKKDWLDEKKLKKAQIESKNAKRLAELLKCDVCNKSFTSKRALTLHKKTHEK